MGSPYFKWEDRSVDDRIHLLSNKPGKDYSGYIVAYAAGSVLTICVCRVMPDGNFLSIKNNNVQHKQKITKQIAKGIATKYAKVLSKL